MIGIDINVMIRYLTQDDKYQSPRATKFIEKLSSKNPGFISLVVIAEIYWVLNRKYQLTHNHTTSILHIPLTTEQLIIQESEIVYRALSASTEK